MALSTFDLIIVLTWTESSHYNTINSFGEIINKFQEGNIQKEKKINKFQDCNKKKKKLSTNFKIGA